ncbi:pyruvate, phosphate dikinase [Alcanivorax sp. JB21]|uniref:PEP-utilizing enzyme n=1 Tax=Alcanivorax limicola TaxID=2874102 RepID=UPI001CBAD696|nr:PEP-utilizing enzyme [Alcanivorax limicola]MBZ2187868.1 pyruvate, phosphate dikinase [Alcanivorax limicola]
MIIDALSKSRAHAAERLQQWAALDLPVPPTWCVSRGPDVPVAFDVAAILEALAGKPGAGDHYWILHQGPATPGSQRQSLVNLDSDTALSAALVQLFSKADAPDQVIIQALPRRHAAGVLFTRHPVRQDLEHVIVEGVVEQGVVAQPGTPESVQERLILHRDGLVAYSSQPESALIAAIGARPFKALADQLRRHFERPQACEWVHDGEQLWLIQTLPVGSLPRPEEAWSRRAGSGIWQQAVSPLWYTLAGRWLKTGFWRPLGERLGWHDLANIEPYRRQHSHIYTNSRFFLRLYEQGGPARLTGGLPPAWQPRETPTAKPWQWRRDGLRRLTTGLALASLARELQQANAVTPALGDLEGQWRQLMRYDRAGERLAAIDGWLAYCAPEAPAEAAAPTGDAVAAVQLAQALPPAHLANLQRLGLGREATLAPHTGFGVDPVLPRFSAALPELAALASVSPERRHALARLADAEAGNIERHVRWRRQAAALREQLGSQLRSILATMGQVLVARQLLRRAEDIHFVYFDELWSLWQRQGQVQDQRRLTPEKIGERKVRYLTSAYQGAPDWMLDQVAYGVKLDQQEKPVLKGRALVPETASGPARMIHSGWALSGLEPGDIVVLDQCEPGWLPWLALAEGLVLASHDPLHPAALFARALGIPCVAGVDDAMHCLVDGAPVRINTPEGSVLADDGQAPRQAL